jgi:hypothetical protein
LQRLDLQNDIALADQLIRLQTDGKGLPDNEDEFMAWKELVLVEDEHSAKMMKGIDGLWIKRIEEHLQNIQRGKLSIDSSL